MAKSKTEVKILVVSNDPAAPKELGLLLGNAGTIRTLFADTTNAVNRAFATGSVDLVMIRIDAHDLALLEGVVRRTREQTEYVPILGIIKADDARSAVAAATIGIEGLVVVTNPRQVKRLADYMVDSIRARREGRIAVQRLGDIEDRYTLLLDSSSEAIAYIHEGLHIYANRAYLELFRFESFEELEGMSMLDLLSGSEQAPDLKKVLKALARDEIPKDAMIFNAHRQDGDTFKAMVKFSPARLGGENCAQLLVREEVHQADPELARELEKLKTSDMLTGLLNRPAFLERLRALAAGREDISGLSILMLSLDKHDQLQTKIGLGATDALIRESADVFSRAVGEKFPIARIGDHTFGVLADLYHREEAEKLASRIVEFCAGRILDVRDISLTVSASVGLAVSGSELADPEMLLSQADSALSEALRAGGNAYVRYRPRVSGDADEDDSAWAERLHHALDNDEFRLVSSLITSMEDDNFLINEIETRLRTEDSDEVLMPEVYLPAAARLDLAVRLDIEMLRRFWALLAERQNNDNHYLVPLSLDSLTDNELLTRIDQSIKQATIEPDHLILGVREPEVRNKLRQAQGFIERFKPQGTRFALCEVGPESDYQTLVQHLDFDYLRLTPEMTHNLSGSVETRQRLSSLVSSTDAKKVKIIAPKAEHTGDLAALWQYGITLVQGDFVREEASA